MKEIKLTQGKIALVDDEDFDFLNQWKWFASKSGNTYYALRTVHIGKTKRTIIMHRELLGISDSKILKGDHKDGNGLNNQRYNIRPASQSQNCANKKSEINSTSKYLGVCWSKVCKKWHATASEKGKRYHLGYYATEEEAALAYNEGAIKLHGEFARLNKIEKTA